MESVVDRTGQLIGGRWRIETLIGRGAMADVFRAQDLETSAHVAVKILRTELGDPSARARFQREGEVQARIRHKNVAALLGSGVTDRREPYLAMELLRGANLRGVVKRSGAVEPRRAASYIWQALQGLAAVHALGVLHRDLKPANIMLEPSPGPVERVVLIDFGFASTEGAARLTATGAIVGSLAYLAPERMRGEPIDARSDLYAIATIFYELLAGRPPFVGATDMELVDAQLHHTPAPLSYAFDDVLQRALAKHQAERFADAHEMIAALEAAATRLA